MNRLLTVAVVLGVTLLSVTVNPLHSSFNDLANSVGNTAAAAPFFPALDHPNGDMVEQLGSTFSTGFHDAVAGTFGKTMYVAGGFGTTYRSDIHSFHVLTDTLVDTGHDLLHAVTDAGGAALGGRLWVFGGNDGTTRSYLQDYDPATGTVGSNDTGMPVPLQGMAVATDGTYAYLFGGDTGSGLSNKIYRFDPADATFTEMAGVLPTARRNAEATFDGTAFHIFGGFDTAPLSQILRYDPVTDTVTTLAATLSPARERHMVTYVDGYHYAIGGGTSGSPTTFIDAFNAATGTVRRIDAVLPFTARDSAFAAYGDLLYLFGGFLYSANSNIVYRFEADGLFYFAMGQADAVSGLPRENMGSADDGQYVWWSGGMGTSSRFADIVRYDPVLDVLTTLSGTGLGTARHSHSMVHIDGTLWNLGGNTTATARTNAVDSFDLDTLTRTTRTALPQAREGMAAVALGTDIYLFGGQDGSSSMTAQILRYDTLTGATTVLPATLPTPRSYADAVVYGDYVYILGGHSAAGAILRFDPSDGSITDLGLALPNNVANGAAFVANNTIYVLAGNNSASATRLTQVVAYWPHNGTVDVHDCAVLPTARDGVGSGSTGRYGFVFAGRSDSGLLSTIHRFDPWGACQGEHVVDPGLTTAPFTLGTVHYLGTSAWHNGKLYHFGGFTQSSRWYEIDPVVGTIVTRSNIPFAVGYGAAVSVDGHIYVHGGSTTTFRRVAPDSGVWTALAAAPADSTQSSAIAHYDGKIYLFGGNNGAPTNTVYAYDIATNSWSLVTTMGISAFDMTAVSDGTHIYVTGGSGNALGQVYKFNPETGTGTTIMSVAPSSVQHAEAAWLNGALYAFGGYFYHDKIQRWDPITETWSTTLHTLPQPVYGVAAAAHNDIAYITGGLTSTGATNTVHYFTP